MSKKNWIWVLVIAVLVLAAGFGMYWYLIPIKTSAQYEGGGCGYTEQTLQAASGAGNSTELRRRAETEQASGNNGVALGLTRLADATDRGDSTTLQACAAHAKQQGNQGQAQTFETLAAGGASDTPGSGSGSSPNSGGATQRTYPSRGGGAATAPQIAYTNCADKYNDGRVKIINQITDPNYDVQVSLYQLDKDGKTTGYVKPVAPSYLTKKEQEEFNKNVGSTEFIPFRSWGYAYSGRIPSGQYQLNIYINQENLDYPRIIIDSIKFEVKDCEWTTVTIPKTMLNEKGGVEDASICVIDTSTTGGSQRLIDQGGQRETTASIQGKVATTGACTTEQEAAGGKTETPSGTTTGGTTTATPPTEGTRPVDTSGAGTDTITGVTGGAGPGVVKSGQGGTGGLTTGGDNSGAITGSAGMDTVAAASSEMSSVVGRYNSSTEGAKKLVNLSANDVNTKSDVLKAVADIKAGKGGSSDVVNELGKKGYSQSDIEQAASIISQLAAAAKKLDPEQLAKIANSLGTIASEAQTAKFFTDMSEALQNGQELSALIANIDQAESYLNVFDRLSGTGVDVSGYLNQAKSIITTAQSISNLLGAKSDSLDTVATKAFKSGAAKQSLASKTASSKLGNIGSFIHGFLGGIF